MNTLCTHCYHATCTGALYGPLGGMLYMNTLIRDIITDYTVATKYTAAGCLNLPASQLVITMIM